MILAWAAPDQFPLLSNWILNKIDEILAWAAPDQPASCSRPSRNNADDA